MGATVEVEHLTKSFGRQNIWHDVSLTLPAGEISALLGPSGTGKSVFLKTLIGLVRPERGTVRVDGVDVISCGERELQEVRKRFGVLFQDGALFGSLSLYDNVAFPLREHTRKGESEIRRIVEEKMELVGLAGAGAKLPGQISGGMRKRAGLARALVLDPDIILVDEPDSGLDPVRTSYLAQTLVDLNAELDTTILIVTHNIELARRLPDNLGMLFNRRLVMFGPREVMLTCDEPVVEQFLNGRRLGPIGMSEEKDAATAALEAETIEEDDETIRGLVPQMRPSRGLPDRPGEARRAHRVTDLLHALPARQREEILAAAPAPEAARWRDLHAAGTAVP
ncbi:ABC transporter ATP-binding protein [Lapillicoccus jejuensis]|uniref:Phospholipid/cholesterol/gamma-HCH transport system ATP-binding protein n=1 Tax=Lapillicoccus jejuensis TaxID=402171 RepID=A0A542DWI0_9MICO|nr:ABC transporter ATP-binding protein [Lapillicoccus jejuensis]TQJ07440.1 phospholipid/cholesterol/gamma-HCH transport system ATP-binding protein [Lapillicoccus jejuensis]